MWTCPLCSRQFVNSNQQHSCNDKTVADFLNGKSQHSISLYWHFIKCYEQIGDIAIQPTKTMIAVAAKTRFAYITRIGKDFIDIVFPFKESYNDNVCFHKIAKVPGQEQFNHHFRMQQTEDVNLEVQFFMKLAYDNSL